MKPTPEQRLAFGSKVRRLRNERGETIQYVVDQLRPIDPTISVAKLSAWERGEYAPSTFEAVTLLEQHFGLEGELHAVLGGPPPALSEIEMLEQRVVAIEKHLGIGQVKPERHLRAADAAKVADPGPRKRKGKARPTGAASEFE